MLGYGVSNDTELLTDLYKKIFSRNPDFVIGYVLYEDDIPVGIANLKVNPKVSEMKEIGLLPEKRNKGFGDFFTRCLLLRLSEVSEKIITYKNQYFYKFGFVDEDNKMAIDSKKIDFPSTCKHK
ncbi:hypothetical protein EOM82_02965 [bacterium]|nr:hypothetical protein [bacterium]